MAGVPATRKEALDRTLKEAIAKFRSRFGSDPDIASFAPGRVNLIGEHTDYNDGCVLPIALQLVTVVVGKQKAGNQCTIVSTSDLSEAKEETFAVPGYPGEDAISKEEKQPRTLHWSAYFKGVVALMNQAGNIPAFEAVISTCIPLGGGLSSSAALEVATCLFTEELCNRASVPQLSRSLKEKALLCQLAEHMYAYMPCGIMDQFVSVLAQENKALYIDCRRTVDGSIMSKAVPFPTTEKTIFLVANSGVKHNLGDSEYPKRKEKCRLAAEALGKASLRDATMEEVQSNRDALNKGDDVPNEFMCASHVIGEISRTIEAVEKLEKGDYPAFGQLMNSSHTSLSESYKVSCDELDCLVQLAQKEKQVYGSRMTGGGFGGCTVTLVLENNCDEIIEKLRAGYNKDKQEATFYKAVPSSGAGIVPVEYLAKLL